MYDFKMLDNEEIVLIDDYVLVKNNSEYLTFIITNKRLLALDYPSSVFNAREDLRISGKMNYIKMKELILDKKITEIKNIEENSEYSKITFENDTYIEIKSKDITNKLKEVLS